MSELMFECYQVPSVCYGVDALFSYYYNNAQSNNVVPNGLVISSSYMYTHILPVVNNKLMAQSVKRYHHSLKLV
jgi:actin-related protein 5